MANEILQKLGTPLVWADATDYSSTISGLARTAQIDLTSLANGSYRQGDKADCGATKARQFRVFVGLEFIAAPTSREMVYIYWASSPSATAGNANPGGCSGADGAYSGSAGDSAADSVLQLQEVGSFICTADASTTVQYQEVGILSDILRYGMPVIFNDSGQAFFSDAVEMFIALIPIIDEVQ